MADAERYYLTKSDRDKLRKMRAAFDAQNRNITGGNRNSNMRPTSGSFDAWFPFYNDSGETIPAYAIMRVTGSTDAGQETGIAVGSGNPLLKVGKPNTTFANQYVANGGQDIEANSYGWCLTSGPVLLLYDSGTPANGDGCGPKPGQWSLSKGFPATTLVDGLHDSTPKILLGSLQDIQTALIRFTGSVSNNTSTTSYKIYAGTMGSESDAGFTTVPSARNRTGARVNNDWAVLHRINDGWEIVNLEDAASDAEIFRVTLGGPVTDGGTISITSPVAGSVTAHNEVNGAALLSGDVVTAYKDKGDATYQLIKTQAGTATEIYNITIPSPGVASLASISVTIPSGTVSATNWSDTTMAAEDYAHVYKNPDDGLYYLFKTGGSGTDYGIIEGLVASPFTKTTYQFLVSVILDDKGTYSAGTLITVQNLYKATTGQYLFEGEGGAMCQFRYSPSAGTFRAIWVECPASDGVQVGLVTEGNQGINLGGYGYGGQADIVSNIYYGV